MFDFLMHLVISQGHTYFSFNAGNRVLKDFFF